jgi:predicted RNA-binding Zn ribbon-like protein
MDFLCLDLVNSSWYITHKLFADPMKDSKWMIYLAEKWNIKGLTPPSPSELQLLMSQRSETSELFAKLGKGMVLNASDVSIINSYMKDLAYKKKFLLMKDKYQLSIIPNHPNWDWFMAEVAASFALLCSTDYSNYLKVCENPDCGWYFIDESKSHNRKWCDDTCSTLMKVRRFRQKQKELI